VGDIQEKGYDPMYGARPVKRVVQQELETGLAKAILRGDLSEDDTVVVSASGGAKARSLQFKALRGDSSIGVNGSFDKSLDLPALI
jgi:ATP-dependent Clp protease ATP-binding subunit ClpB